MRVPTDLERERLIHMVEGYDPAKAHEYYLRTRKLKGRKRGHGEDSSSRSSNGQDPRTGKTRKQISRDARARQRIELADQIDKMEGRLQKLEALIKERAREEASEDRKAKAKKERARKESEKPKTAAEKAKAARESEKYRKEHKQELKTKAKRREGKSGGGSSDSKTNKNKKHSVSELKSLATKVRGQIAVAKRKLAAL